MESGNQTAQRRLRKPAASGADWTRAFGGQLSFMQAEGFMEGEYGISSCCKKSNGNRAMQVTDLQDVAPGKHGQLLMVLSGQCSYQWALIDASKTYSAESSQS